MHLLLCQTKEKTDDENESNELQIFVTQSNEPQSFVTQTIPGWPKYVVTKSENENTQLTKLSPFKLAKSVNDITKRITSVTILSNNYVLLETNNKEQSKLLAAK